MQSTALTIWSIDRAQKLDYMENVHRRVGGSLRGRRFTTEQVNHVYVVVLSAEFQAFCRDLHDECSDHLVAVIGNSNVRMVTRDLFGRGRKLQHGNPNPGNVGSDFARFGVKIWDRVKSRYKHGETWHDRLEALNGWRNAIAHQDYSRKNVGRQTYLTLMQVREWRRSCRGLANAFDKIMKDHLAATTGRMPW